jgi:hypothetical protein
MFHWHTRTGIHPLRTSPQGFLNQGLPKAAIGARYQNGFACDIHKIFTPSFLSLFNAGCLIVCSLPLQRDLFSWINLALLMIEPGCPL